MVMSGRKRVPVKKCKVLKEAGEDFCENTSLHGFSYWISSKNGLERVFWVIVVFICLVCAINLVSSQISVWRNNPTAVQIEQFSLPVTELNYPAITICKKNGFADPGEYLRSVFNNFQLTYTEGDGESCNDTSLLRDHYRQYIGDGSCKRDFYTMAANPLIDSREILWIETLMKSLHIWQHRMSRKMKAKYEGSYDIREKTDFLMLYVFQHGNAGVRKVTDMLMSNLFGGAKNDEEWRMLLGLAWKIIRSGDPSTEAELKIAMRDYVNISSYDPKIMEEFRVSGSYETVHKVAFPFHREGLWYDDCCNPYNSKDYFARLYQLLKDGNNEAYWKYLHTCFDNNYGKVHQDDLDLDNKTRSHTDIVKDLDSMCYYNSPPADALSVLQKMSDFDLYLLHESLTIIYGKDDYGQSMNYGNQALIESVAQVFEKSTTLPWGRDTDSGPGDHGYRNYVWQYCGGGPGSVTTDEEGNVVERKDCLAVHKNCSSEYCEVANNDYKGSDRSTEGYHKEMLYLLLQIQYIDRMLLPEDNFGTQFQHMMPFDTKLMKVNPGIHLDGIQTLFKNVFGSEVQQSGDMANLTGVPLSHPSNIAQLFTLSAPSPTDITFDYKVPGLAKLLHFSNFMDTQSGKAMDYIAKEVNGYPYTKKSKLQEPYPRSFDLEADSTEFKLAPTDVGLCQVYNGNTMKSTFSETVRIQELSSALDQRDSYVPKVINGSGKIYQKTFWLDIGDRSSGGQRQGSATLNINNWLKFFSVRSNPIDLNAGTSYVIKIVPFQHSATPEVKAINWKNRKCLFQDEQKEDSMFKTYSHKGCQFECRLKNSFQYVGCIPWDYPVPPSLGDEENIPICDSNIKEGQKSADSSLAMFNNHMDSKESGADCNCLPDCEQEVRFETQVSMISLNLDDLCTGQNTIERVMRHWQFTRSPLVYWTQKMVKMATTDSGVKELPLIEESLSDPLGGQDIRYGLPDKEVESVCKQMYKNDVVKVSLQIGDPEAMQLKMDVAVTFADALGIVGGTIGLFMGMSIVSVIEAIYWIYRAIKRIVRNDDSD